MKALIFLLLVLFCLNSFADDSFLGNEPGSGFIISVSTPNGISFKSNDFVLIQGKIKFGDSNDKDKNHKNKKSFLENLKKQGIDILAHFPSDSVEVTSNLILKDSGSNEVEFSYTTSVLKANDLNQFSIKIYNNHKDKEKIKRLSEIKAKLERRLLALSDLRQQYHDKKKSEKSIALIQKEIDILSSVIQKISARLNSNSHLLAQYKLPLQVDNLRPNYGYSSTIMNKYLLSLEITPGSLIQGMNSKIKGIITNLRHDNEHDEDNEDLELKLAELKLNNKIVSNLNPQKLNGGESLSFEYETEILSPTPLNDIQWSFYKYKKSKSNFSKNSSDKNKDGKSNNNHHDDDQDDNKLIGYVRYKIPVAQDLIAPQWLSPSSPSVDSPYVKNMAPILLKVTDAFGRIDISSLLVQLYGTVESDKSLYNQNLTSYVAKTKIGDGENYEFSGASIDLAEGLYTLKAQVKDFGGNSAALDPFSVQFRIDRTAPMIGLGIANGYKTNQKSIEIPILINDLSPTRTEIFINNELLFATGSKDFTASGILNIEGNNTIRITSKDDAGNIAAEKTAIVFLDSTPPVLSNLVPANNSRVFKLVFSVSGKSNEPLKEISVNGLTLTLDSTKTYFTGNYIAPANGTETLTYTATDLLGNTSQLTTSVQIDNRLLIPELVTVSPSPDRVHLNIMGVAGSVRSNVDVSASSGLLGFNSDSSTANPDGSFALSLSPFSTATLKVKDPQTNEVATLELSYAISTRLSGVVKDTQGNSLPGATISISSNSETVLTDSSGVFNINSPVTGDQTLTINGSTIPQSVTGVSRKFSSTSIQINIGLGQENILDRPIYLAPLVLDGSESTVVAGEETVVTSPQAPGVQLDIPADSTVFPSGSPSGKINIATIESDKSTVPVLQNVVPKNVIALEPSGLKFEERVPVTLPNENEFPAGVEMFILSMDSSKGTWEVDGRAVVSEDGTTIKTKDGEGISHFSLIYAIPAKPVLAAVDNPKLGGIDISEGSLTTAVSLPSWKSLGVSIAPNLIYKSNWANPTAYVSNYIDIPKQEYTVSYNNSGSASTIEAIKGRYCETFLGATVRCYNTYDEYVLSAEFKESLEYKSWYQPDSIKSQFFIGDLTSGSIEYKDNTTPDYNNTGSPNIPGPVFAGGFGSGITNYTGIPNRAMISYAVPLKNSGTGSYLASGIYPSLARYEITIKNLIYRSYTSYQAYSATFYDAKFADNNKNVVIRDVNEFSKTSKILDEVFPSDIVTPILVQNKVNSAAGRGWHLGLTQNILNPSGNRILIEDESGELATYSISNTISTVYNSTNTGIDTNSAFDFSQWPKVVSLYKDSVKDNYLVEMDLSQNNPSKTMLGKITQISGNFGYSSYFSGYCDSHPGSSETIYDYEYKYKIHNAPASILRALDGTIYSISQRENSLYKISHNSYIDIIKKTSAFTSSKVDHYTNDQIDAKCIERSGELCEQTIFRSYSCKKRCGFDVSFCFEVPYPHGFEAFGKVMAPSGNISNYFTSDFVTTGFNNPQGMITTTDGFLIIADSGNNMVRKVDLINNQISTIAGNGSNIDSADSGPAINAGIFHPKSVVYDNDQNLYILTENGYIRKVDTQGNISHIAALPPAQGGVLADQAPIKQMALYQPSHMIFDSVNEYLYVADTGNHRIIRFDLNTELATTVAGNGTCNPSQVVDNTAALNSSLCNPKYIGLDPDKNLIIVDSGHNRIRKVNFNYSNTGTIAFVPTAKDGSQLYRYSDGTWSRILRNGLIAYFNSNGKQSKSVNRLGKEIIFEYNSENDLSKITDANGQKTFLNYSGGLLSSIIDPAGRTTSFNYNFGNLISVNFPDGSSKIFEYNSEGLMTKEINQRGHSKKYVYNEYNRLASVTDELGNSSQINDVVSGSMSNSYTGGNTGTLNNQGTNPTQLHDRIIDAKSIETQLTKDFNGLVTKIKDGKGQITSIERDLEGLTKKIIFPDSSEVTLEYHPITKDLLKTTDTGTGISESQTFNQYGQITSKTDGKGFTYFKQYNATNGLLEFEQAPNSQKQSYSYNSFGLPTAIIKSPVAGVNLTTNLEYDILGNRSKMILPDGKFILFQYDSAGNIIQKTLQISSSLQEVTKYQFDSFNRMVKVTSPKNEITEYIYLSTGQLSKIKDPLNNETFFEYNQKGLLVKKTEPDNKVYSFNYDANNNLISETNPNGVTKSYTVDELNQITKITLPDDEYNFTYSAKGEVLVASNSVASISQNHDTKGRVIASIVTASGTIGNYPAVSVSYSYDKNSNRETLRSDVLNLDYFYDQSNRLRQINNANGDSFVFDFDNTNRLTKTTRPGSFSTISYNSGNILASIVHSNSNSTIDQNIYSYDQRNIPVQKRTLAGNFDYSYDLSGQITTSNTPAINESFSYDDIGNRITDQSGSYTYSASRKLIEQDYNYTYTHDNNGNMIGKFSKSPGGDKFNFSYTSLNQLKEVKIHSSDNTLKKTVNYYFDPQGRRIKKAITDHLDSSKSFSRSYLYDGEHIIAEFDGSGIKLASYTHSPVSPDDILAADITSDGQDAGLAQVSGKYYYLKDHLGSVDVITDRLGNTVQKYQYSSFGKIVNILDSNNNVITSTPKISTSFTYTGREFDSETGLYFYRARIYDASTGRFLQKDPDSGKIALPNSINNYFVYVDNKPTINIDPSGKFWWLAVVAIVAFAQTSYQNNIKGGNFLEQFAVNFAVGAILYGIGYGIGELAGFPVGYGGTGLATAATDAAISIGINAGVEIGAANGYWSKDTAKLGLLMGGYGQAYSSNELQSGTDAFLVMGNILTGNGPTRFRIGPSLWGGIANAAIPGF